MLKGLGTEPFCVMGDHVVPCHVTMFCFLLQELQQIVVKNPDSDVDISYVNVHSRLYDSHDNHFCSTTQDFSEDYDLEDDDDPARALKRLSDSIPNSYEREVKFR